MECHEEPGNCFAILDDTLMDHFYGIVHLDLMNIEHFILIKISLSGFQVSSNKDVDTLIRVPRYRCDLSHLLPLICQKPRFLSQLSFGAFKGCLVRVEGSCRDLPNEISNGMAIYYTFFIVFQVANILKVKVINKKGLQVLKITYKPFLGYRGGNQIQTGE
jgi:hypothetical protein